MAWEFCLNHRAEFAETDMAGIVHFSNYFRYMERAEHAFLRSLGLSVHADPARAENGHEAVYWPRVQAECSFKSPLTFEEEFEIHLLVRRKTNKTIRYDFALTKADDTLVAKGSITVVCTSIDRGTKQMTAIPIPSWIHEKIETAPAAALAAEASPESSPALNRQGP